MLPKSARPSRGSSKTANFQRAWGKRDAREWKRTFPRHTWWTECYASTKKSWEAQRKLNHAHRGSAARSITEVTPPVYTHEIDRCQGTRPQTNLNRSSWRKRCARYWPE